MHRARWSGLCRARLTGRPRVGAPGQAAAECRCRRGRMPMPSMRRAGGQPPVGLAGQPPAALMDRPMMGPAQHHQVVEVGGVAVQPVPQLMGLPQARGRWQSGTTQPPSRTAIVAAGVVLAGGTVAVVATAERPAEYMFGSMGGTYQARIPTQAPNPNCGQPAATDAARSGSVRHGPNGPTQRARRPHGARIPRATKPGEQRAQEPWLRPGDCLDPRTPGHRPRRVHGPNIRDHQPRQAHGA
jgi:hypothetical protein